jgi:hypothetical protein
MVTTRDSVFSIWSVQLSHNKKDARDSRDGQIGSNVRVRVFNAVLLARSKSASGRSCDRPTRSRFSVVFLDPRANAHLVHKLQAALHASHAALPLVTSKFRPNIALSNVAQSLLYSSSSSVI